MKGKIDNKKISPNSCILFTYGIDNSLPIVVG